MAAKTTFLANRVLSKVLKNDSEFVYAWPATVYAAVFTADPTNTGSIASEVVDAVAPYARQPITWGAISSGSVSNSVAVTYNVAGVSWGTIGWAGVMDVATLLTGNMLYHGPLGTPKVVGIGDQVSFAIGALVATES